MEIIQRTALLDCTLAIAVAAERDCELRRLELRNHSGRERRLEVTTFCEVALLPFAADLSHPAFSRLFIETEFASETGALLARRRPRGRGEVWPLMVHALSGAGGLEWESSRERFIGRGHEIRHPAALERPGALSGSIGRVLDPALCLRRTLTLAPDGEVTLTALLGAATDREQALELARMFATPERIRETFGAPRSRISQRPGRRLAPRWGEGHGSARRSAVVRRGARDAAGGRRIRPA